MIRSRWLVVLGVFGVAGPPIGLFLYLFGLAIYSVFTGGLVAVASNVVSGLGRIPRELFVCYIAAPPALLTGVCVKLVEEHVDFGLTVIVAILAGGLLTPAYALALSAMANLFKGDIGLWVIAAEFIGVLTAFWCLCIVDRWWPLAIQHEDDVTQSLD